MGKQAREKWERRNAIEGEKPQRWGGEFRWEKICSFIITWATYLVLFTPLIISTKFFFPFVAPKTTLFRIIVEIIFVAYLFLVLSNSSKYRPRINGLTLVLTLFLAVFILASFTGINLERSFWSTYERMTGIWTMLHLYAFFIILSSVFKKRKDWEKILGASVIAGVFLSLYTLGGNEVSTRGGGTIGNTSFMAAYLLFDVFFAIILFLSKRGIWQIFAGVSLAIMLPALLTSTAQGAIASFFLGLFLLALGYLIFSRKKALQRLAFGIILLLVISGTILLILQPPFVENRINLMLKEMNSRFVVWETGLKGFLERPILGWGPENFNVVFLKYFNPCMSLSECGSEVWFDRVHNIVFDTLVATGIVGLLAYLSIFGVAIYGLLNLASKVSEMKNVFIPLGLVTLLTVYFFQNLLVFDMINTYLVFFLSLGFVNFLIQKPKEVRPPEEVGPQKINPILGSAVIIAMIFILWFGNIQPIVANRYIIQTVGTPYIDQVISFFQKSLSSQMNKYEAREYFVQRMVKAVRQDPVENMRPAFQEALDLAESEMEKSIKENSLDFRHHLFLGELYVNDYRFSNNQEKIKRAQIVLEKAMELSPTNQQGYWELAEVKVIEGKVAEAISLLKKAIELEPRVGSGHWYLAMAYQIAGDYQSAVEEIQLAREGGHNWINNPDQIKRVLDIYKFLDGREKYNRQELDILLRLTELESQNADAWARLAAAYANLGQFKKARETAQKVLEINPDLAPEVEEFLKSLP